MNVKENKKKPMENIIKLKREEIKEHENRCMGLNIIEKGLEQGVKFFYKGFTDKFDLYDAELISDDELYYYYYIPQLAVVIKEEIYDDYGYDYE